jgi:hypothetical protein
MIEPHVSERSLTTLEISRKMLGWLHDATGFTPGRLSDGKSWLTDIWYHVIPEKRRHPKIAVDTRMRIDQKWCIERNTGAYIMVGLALLILVPPTLFMLVTTLFPRR